MSDAWTSWTPEKERKLLKEFRAGRSVAAACRAARIGRSTYYKWRDDDAEFAARCDDAIEDGTDLLEDEAADRATRDENPSDTLLIFLLKARRADKYRDNATVRHEGNDGGPMRIEVVGIDAEDI